MIMCWYIHRYVLERNSPWRLTTTRRPSGPRSAACRERAAYDRATLHAILDEGFLCHVGFVAEGQPYVIPTGYARIGKPHDQRI